MKHLLVVIFIFGSGFLFSQEIKSPVSLMTEEGRKILEHPEYEKRREANRLFSETLKEYLVTEEGFNDPLKPVTNMMRLELGKKARIYTWQMPDSAFQYVRYGLVAAETDKGIKVTELEEHTQEPNAQFRRLKAEDWYGAIYYEVVPVKKDGKEVYTLLGYAPGKPVNRKFVDVIEIDPKGKPRFGGRVFKVDQFMDKTLNKPPMRLILTYGGDYAASVRWQEDEEMIVMDHLAPPKADLEGVYQMYGPDMTYDALVWDDDWWHLREEVEFNSGQDIQIKPPDKPTDLPPGNKPRRPERN